MDEKYPLALQKGTVLAGQYIIEEVLGQGGFGITYRASEYKTNNIYAIKEFFPDVWATRTGTSVVPHSGQREENFRYGMECFLDEAKTLAKFIGSENIVKIHTYFEENDTAYFVMDFVEGISFDAYIKTHGGRVDYETAERILLPIIDALALVHEKGIVHRDVTPDNIYITNYGNVKLLDFGAARYSLGDKSRSLDVILKHGFAPKEQYARHGRQGPYTDVYAVGASFYFALTGKRPPDSIDRMEKDELVIPSALGVNISQQKEDAILKALEVQPADRYQSMRAFRSALMGEAVKEGNIDISEQRKDIQYNLQPQQQYIVQEQEADNKKGRRRILLPVMISVLVVAAIAGSITAITLGGRKKQKDEDKPVTAEQEQPAEIVNVTVGGVYEINPYDLVKANNLTDKGCAVGTGNDIAYCMNQYLYYFNSDTLAKVKLFEGEKDSLDVTHISEVFDANGNVKGYRFVYDGIVYSVNKDGSDLAVFYDDTYVEGLYDNGRGAFLIHGEDQSVYPRNIDYINWEDMSLLSGDIVESRNINCMTFDGTNLYYVIIRESGSGLDLYRHSMEDFGDNSKRELIYSTSATGDEPNIVHISYADGYIYFGGYRNETPAIGRIDASTGDVRTFEFNDIPHISSFNVYGGYVYFGTNNYSDDEKKSDTQYVYRVLGGDFDTGTVNREEIFSAKSSMIKSMSVLTNTGEIYIQYRDGYEDYINYIKISDISSDGETGEALGNSVDANTVVEKNNNTSNYGKTLYTDGEICYVDNLMLYYENLNGGGERINIDSANDEIGFISEIRDENQNVTGYRYVKDGALCQINKDGSGGRIIYNDYYVWSLYDGGDYAVLVYSASKTNDDYKLAHIEWDKGQVETYEEISVSEPRCVLIMGGYVYYHEYKTNHSSIYRRPIKQFYSVERELLCEINIGSPELFVGAGDYIYVLGKGSRVTDPDTNAWEMTGAVVRVNTKTGEAAKKCYIEEQVSYYGMNIYGNDLYLNAFFDKTGEYKIIKIDTGAVSGENENVPYTVVRECEGKTCDMCIVSELGQMYFTSYDLSENRQRETMYLQ